MNTGIQLQDDLDILLAKKIQDNKRSFFSILTKSANAFTLSDEEIGQLHQVYLFKSDQDLKDL